jgi:hypothetical protein
MNPAVRTLIPQLVSYVTGHSGYVTKTKLLKILYLFDVEFYRLHQQTYTGFNWKFFHLGPWTSEYDPLIDELVSTEVLTRTSSSRTEYDTVFYRSSVEADLDEQLKSYKDAFVLRTILETWAERSTGEILDYVYFRTEPMENAIRNEPLNFSSISTESALPYKRSQSGKSLQEIRRRRAEFQKRISSQTQKHFRFQFTPAVYDSVFAEGISKLDESDR